MRGVNLPIPSAGPSLSAPPSQRSRACLHLQAANEGTAAGQVVMRLMDAGLLTVPSGETVVRLLPPLNLSSSEAAECLGIIERTLEEIAASGA